MSVRRVMGLETEYAVASNTDDTMIQDNPIELSYAIVAAAPGYHGPRWDYRAEDPVNDARGYRMPRASASPDILTDAPRNQVGSIIAPNGGRIYVDHAHPEYATPEAVTPQEVLAADRAGDGFMLQAAAGASQTLGRRVQLLRNNTDGKGSSWGAHESYQIQRSVDFELLARLMTTHFVTRQIFTGAGRVGIGEHCETPGFQLSQRADFFHTKIGLQTTFDRPIVNTRDESHSTENFRRLHVIVGDSNCMDTPEVLRLGTTSLLAWLLENADMAGFDVLAFLRGTDLADPVAAMHAVSHDLSLGQNLALASGEVTTAWNLQVRLRAAVYTVAAGVYGTDSRGEPLWPDDETRQVIDLWGKTLTILARVRHESPDERLADTSGGSHLEWLLKWQILEGLRRRKNREWDSPLLSAVDLSWADLDPAHGVAAKMVTRMESIASARDVERAVDPPETTRAWLRTALLDRFGDNIVAVAWKQMVVRHDDGSAETVEMGDPLAFSRESFEQRFENAETLADIVAVIQESSTMRENNGGGKV